MRLAQIVTLCVSVGILAAAPPPIVVCDAWSRPAIGTAVVYATLHNTSAATDRLIGASSPLATHVTLHQSSETQMGRSMPMKDPSMGAMPLSGSMISMKSLSSIAVPAHGTTKLAPGGYHLMLDLRHDLKAGETVPLRLHFKHAGWVLTQCQVRGM